ncbi:MAG: RNA pseudouridine synthase [Firmicutes bacterium]|nr:RNA pseudouridine synthase [Bacillota bacterium]
MQSEIPFLYEDNHLLVVEKPVNMLSQRDITGDPDLLSLLKQKLKEKYQKPGNVYLALVHRLDRPTGGVMVLAKTSKAAARLSAQIRNNVFKRSYLAVVHGILRQKEAILLHYLRKNRQTNMVTAYRRKSLGAKEAKLTYQLLETNNHFSLVKVQLHTGRAHQIRAQFAAVGHPLVGDQRYGQNLTRPGQQLALWAFAVSLEHPTLKKRMTFTSYPAQVFPWAYFKRLKGNLIKE